MLVRRLLFCSLSLLVFACSARSTDAPPPPPPPGDGGTPGRDGTVVPPPIDECITSTEEAMEGFAPIDIVFVVDSSGSMSNEAERVQDNLNRFSMAFTDLRLDYHVVMITTSAYVSVPPPLGIDTERYLLIDRPVSSNEPLRALIDEFRRYEGHLRRTAITHFVAVTDDETDLSAVDFRSMMSMRLGKSFTFHAIASEYVPGGFLDGACTNGGFPPDGAAAPGIEYYALADLTGGTKHSICADDWIVLFDVLTAAIAIPQLLPCVYPIPADPEGGELDPFEVNIVYTPGTAVDQLIPYVGTDDGANCLSGGWYYDNPADPDSILLCPSTCDMINDDPEGRVDVAFGCMTFII